jgi:predicted AlkP superfamily phosphohydrolase/phosphomutase
MTSAPRVLALGIDAAEPSLVRRLLGDGDLPSLAALLDHGVWRRVRSPADLGSGAVWPTFTTGQSPLQHHVHSTWAWDAGAMRARPVTIDHLVPFWKGLADAGHPVCVLDVPFTRPLALRAGVEVSEWGPHDRVRGQTEVWPASMRDVVVTAGGRHPYATARGRRWATDDEDEQARFIEQSLLGVRQRGALARELLRRVAPRLLVLGFTEIHRASHLLWHTVDPDHPRHVTVRRPDVAAGLRRLLQEVDRQIGRLVEQAGPEASVLVFSLHGMRGSPGVADAILDPLLAATGFARPATVTTPIRRGAQAVTRRLPRRLKRFYQGHLPAPARAWAVGPPGEVPSYDWSATAAFRLPTDQHGWLRVNLTGREAAGIVSGARYQETCDRLEELLREVATEAGVRLITGILRPHPAVEVAARSPLPDLVVHFDPAAVSAPLRLRRPSVSAPLRNTTLTGEHAPEGFLLCRSPRLDAQGLADPVPAADLHRLILDLLGRQPSA